MGGTDKSSISRKGRGIRARALERLTRLSAEAEETDNLERLTSVVSPSEDFSNGSSNPIVSVLFSCPPDHLHVLTNRSPSKSLKFF